MEGLLWPDRSESISTSSALDDKLIEATTPPNCSTGSAIGDTQGPLSARCAPSTTSNGFGRSE